MASSLSLTKPNAANTLAAFLDAHNSNMSLLEARVPEPCATGSNGGLNYRLWPDGWADIWGKVLVPASKSQIGGANGDKQYTVGYISDPFTFSWPVQLVNSEPIYVVRAKSTTYPDVFVMDVECTSTYYKGQFYAQFAEKPGQWSGVSDKYVYVIAKGRWRD